MVTRSGLPQNWLRTAGTLFQDFETLEDFESRGSATLETDSTHCKTGTKSLKITGPSGTTGGARWTINNDLSETRFWRVWIYCHTDPATTIDYVTLSIGSSLTMAKSFSSPIWGGSALRLGWNVLSFNKGYFSNNGGDDWGNTMVKMQFYVTAKSGQIPIISVDSVHKDSEDYSSVLLSFDDGRIGVYTIAYPYMADRGLVGTCYVDTANVGASENRMNLTQLGELHDAGWTIANHSHHHYNLSTLSDEEVISELTLCQDYLTDHGFTRGSEHVAYPFGGYNSNVLAIMEDLGMLTGRTTESGGISGDYCASNPYELKSRALGYPGTAAAAIADMELYMRRGMSYCTFVHNLATAHVVGDTDWVTANFQALIDRVYANKYRSLTIDEWYNGLTNPRYRSLPVGRT